jgi:hypothetical protein
MRGNGRLAVHAYRLMMDDAAKQDDSAQDIPNRFSSRRNRLRKPMPLVVKTAYSVRQLKTNRAKAF